MRVALRYVQEVVQIEVRRLAGESGRRAAHRCVLQRVELIHHAAGDLLHVLSVVRLRILIVHRRTVVMQRYTLVLVYIQVGNLQNKQNSYYIVFNYGKKNVQNIRTWPCMDIA